MSEPTPVFDYPLYGMVDTYNDERLQPTIDRAVDRGASAIELFELLRDEQVRQLRADPSFREEVRHIYREAGVNLISPTMTSYTHNGPGTAPEGHRRDLARWHARIDAVEWLRKVTSPDRAREVVADGDVGVILNTQNLGLAIDGDVDEIERLFDFGLRIAQLTYNSQNLIGTGCTERVDAGLSNHGVEAIETCNDLGMVVDLSHCGTQTTLDAIEVSDAPVAVTHAFCRAVEDHDRGKSDEEIEALAAADGYMGIQVSPPFIAPGHPEDAYEVFFDHVDHAVSVLGTERVGIGSDWGVIPSTEVPEELREGLQEHFSRVGFREEHGVEIATGFGPMRRYDDWGVIPDGLADRGYSEAEIERLVGRNFLAFWDRVGE